MSAPGLPDLLTIRHGPQVDDGPYPQIVHLEINHEKATYLLQNIYTPAGHTETWVDYRRVQ